MIKREEKIELFLIWVAFGADNLSLDKWRSLTMGSKSKGEIIVMTVDVELIFRTNF